MKTLNEYLKMPYRMELVEDPDEGGFVVSYPDLPGCITCGISFAHGSTTACSIALQKFSFSFIVCTSQLFQ